MPGEYMLQHFEIGHCKTSETVRGCFRGKVAENKNREWPMSLVFTACVIHILLGISISILSIVKWRVGYLKRREFGKGK